MPIIPRDRVDEVVQALLDGSVVAIPRRVSSVPVAPSSSKTRASSIHSRNGLIDPQPLEEVAHSIPA